MVCGQPSLAQQGRTTSLTFLQLKVVYHLKASYEQNSGELQLDSRSFSSGVPGLPLPLASKGAVLGWAHCHACGPGHLAVALLPSLLLGPPGETGLGGAMGTGPDADPYLLVCLFPRATEPGRGVQPPQKEKRTGNCSKGMMK